MLRFVILMTVLLAFPAHAQNEVDFLFAEDNQNTRTSKQFGDGIRPKSLIKQNEWLNAPLTRLDYVLMSIEARLNKEAREAALEYLPQYFERSTSIFARPSADFSARYAEERGRLVLIGTIRDVGKRKKPMKEFCRSILSFLSMLYPHNPIGYSWQNTALRILQRGASTDQVYDDAAKTLAESAVYSVSVTSTYKIGDKDAIYEMSCRQQEDGGEITYSSFSGYLRGR
jgi:hypothetical protein